MQIKLAFTRKVLHLASFWKWEFLELGNDPLFYFFLLMLVQAACLPHVKNQESWRFKKCQRSGHRLINWRHFVCFTCHTESTSVALFLKNLQGNILWTPRAKGGETCQSIGNISKLKEICSWCKNMLRKTCKSPQLMRGKLQVGLYLQSSLDLPPSWAVEKKKSQLKNSTPPKSFFFSIFKHKLRSHWWT